MSDVSLEELEFEKLLQWLEGPTLDFKADGYDIADERKRHEFVKDVVCLANTPREEPAYLVLGVKKFPDGKFELWGIKKHPDEADLQQLFTDRIYPIPAFSYTPVAYRGKDFALIRVPPVRRGPCVAIYDLGALRGRQVYFRRGSRNDLAAPDEIHAIVEWAGGRTGNLRPAGSTDGAWGQFREVLQQDDPIRHHLLITAPFKNDFDGRLSVLGRLPWTTVIDFDPASETDGLLHAISPTLEQRRTLHRVTKGDRPTLGLRSATYWLFARGLEGRIATLSTGSWREWKNAYGQELSDQLSRLARSVAPSPVTCVVLWDDTEELLRHLNSALEAAVSAFGPSLQILVVAPDNVAIQDIARTYDASLFDIPLPQLCAGLGQDFQEAGTNQPGVTRIPASSGATVHLNERERLWIEEEAELVHLDAGLVPPEGKDVGRDFLCGGEVSWYELGLHWDVERDKAGGMLRKVVSDLESRRCLRATLFHAPGAGGTTLARHLLWQLHRVYPCIILRRTVPGETADRIYKLVSLTSLPVLVLIDGSDIAEAKIDELFDQLRSRNIPAVLLQVLRRLSPAVDRERSVYLPSALTHGEARRFVEALIRVQPERAVELRQVEHAAGTKECTPFFFGLTAFGADFRGIESYVANHLVGVTEEQRRTLLYISLTHHYAHHAFPSQAFSQLLSIPPGRTVRLARVLPQAALDLLVESEPGAWRTVHDLIAVEILVQLMRTTGGDRRTWAQNLSGLAREFIVFYGRAAALPSEDVIEIIRRAVIYRDNSETAGGESGSPQFSPLLEDIPSNEGRLNVLRAATEAYPEEAHFWAHLGRFLSVRMKDYDGAADSIDRALILQPNDSVLHHIRGMILRHEIDDLIERKAGIDQLVEIAQEGSRSFRAAREGNPDQEHGYISEAQMLLRVLDYVGRQHGTVFAYLSSAAPAPFLLEALDQIEHLLEQVRRNREGGSESSYEASCRARLANIYGRYDSALQSLEGALQKGSAYKPTIRRQLVRTYLARRDRRWGDLQEKEIVRIVGLLDDNLQEKGTDDRDLRLWMQAVRFLKAPPSVESVIEKVAYWKANTGSLDATYYLYVLHSLLALEDSTMHRDEALRYVDECRQLARSRRNRTKSFEWLGFDKGIGSLVHQSLLGEWESRGDFWEKADLLAWIPARIVRIDGPQAGILEVEGGLQAFFVPGRGGFVAGQQNVMVECYLGFSYDGPRAWNVSIKSSET